MKLAVIGSRGFSDYLRLSVAINQHFSDDGVLSVSEIISGGATGADFLGVQFARERGIKLTEYLPDWGLYGKRAGFVRNELIVKDCDALLAAWDGISKGTANSLSIAKRLKKDTVIIYF